MRLVECVPNFSEGRRPDVVAAIRDAIAAGILLIREAGGIVTDLTGAPARVDHTGLVTGNAAMHEWLMKVVAGR